MKKLSQIKVGFVSLLTIAGLSFSASVPTVAAADPNTEPNPSLNADLTVSDAPLNPSFTHDRSRSGAIPRVPPLAPVSPTFPTTVALGEI